MQEKKNSGHENRRALMVQNSEKRTSLHYRGATLWNSLLTTSKTQTTITGFKESLMT